MPSQEGITKQILLGQDPELGRQIRVEHRDINGGEMIDGVDMRLCRINLLHADHLHLHPNSTQDYAGPETGNTVLKTSIAIKERGEQGDRAQYDGVKPDQRIVDEIGTQARQGMPESAAGFVGLWGLEFSYPWHSSRGLKSAAARQTSCPDTNLYASWLRQCGPAIGLH